MATKFPLDHVNPGGLPGGIGLSVKPETIGLAVSADDRTGVVTNNHNDSITVVDIPTASVRFEYDLRPFNTSGSNGVPGGEYPFDVVISGTNAYISSTRDREVVVVDISGKAGRLVGRIPLAGNPYGMTISNGTLFVAEDNQDRVAMIDLASNTLIREIDVRAPAGVISGPRYTGTAPYAVTVSPDNKTLYVVNNGANDIAVVPLDGSGALSVKGLIPTAYAPRTSPSAPTGRRCTSSTARATRAPTRTT